MFVKVCGLNKRANILQIEKLSYGEGLVIGSRFRLMIQNPYKILSEMTVAPSHRFLDVGCGTGFLSIPASNVVGRDGVVYAVDVSEQYLNELRRRVQQLGIQNIRVINTPAEKLENVPDDSVDRAAFLFSLHHVGDIEAAFEKVRRKLRKTGMLYVLDPVKSRFFGHGTNPSKAMKILNRTGFDVKLFKEGLIFWKMLAQPV